MTHFHSTRQGDAVARRVTISLACKSRAFADAAGDAGVAAIQRVRKNEWSYTSLTKRQIMLIDDGLEQADKKLAADFLFTGHVYALNDCSGTCELCGQEHVKFLFALSDRHTGEQAFSSVGSSCIYTYLWNALGVATAEEAKSLLDGYINDLIRLQDAVVQHKAFPTLFDDMQRLHQELARCAQGLHDYNASRAAKELDRAIKGKHGYLMQAVRIEKVARTALTNASKHLPDTDSFIQELRYALDHKIGYLSVKRLEQVQTEWPQQLAGLEQRYAEAVRRAQEQEAARRVLNIKATQEQMQRLLTERRDYMTDAEAEIIQKLHDDEVILREIDYMDSRRRLVMDVERRTQKVGESPATASAGASPTPDWEQIKTVLEEAKSLDNYSADFAFSLLTQLRRSGKLTERQVAFVLGDDNGIAPNGKPSLRKKVELLCVSA